MPPPISMAGKHIFCFPSKPQTFTIAVEWFPSNHKLEMKVLNCNNAIFPSFWFQIRF